MTDEFSDGGRVIPVDFAAKERIVAPFPEIPETVEGLTPEIVQMFILATNSHLEAGEVSGVVTQLRNFPDHSFAARIALGSGESYGSREVIELAPELDPSEEIAQKAGALLLSDLLQQANILAVEDMIAIDADQDLEESNFNDSLEERDEREVQIAAELAKLQILIDQSQTPAERRAAYNLYDAQAASYITELVAKGGFSQALEIYSGVQTPAGRSHGASAFDNGIINILEHLHPAETDLLAAEEMLNFLLTASGNSRGRQAFDKQAILAINRLSSSGDFEAAQRVTSMAKTAQGRYKIQKIYDDRLIERIQSVLGEGDISLAQQLSQSLRTMSGRSQASTKIRTAINKLTQK